MNQKPAVKVVFSTMLRLYRTTKEYWLWGILRFFGGIGAGGFGVLAAYLSGRMVEVALSRDTNVLVQYAVITIGATIARSVLGYVNGITGSKYSIYSGKKLKKMTMEKIHSLPIGYYENKHTGESVSKLVNDIELLQDFYGNSISGIWSYVPVTLILSGIILVGINLSLTIICAVLIILFGFIINIASIPINKVSKNRQAGIALYNSYLRDFFEGIHIYKSFNMHSSHCKKFEEACQKVAEDSFLIARKKAFTTGLSILGMIVPQIISLTAGGIFVAKGQITIGELFIFTNVLWPFLWSFRSVVSAWTDMIEQTGRASHLFELHDTMAERTTGNNDINSDIHAIIEFRHVGFSYHEDSILLEDISFRVNAGEKTALVGSSGCGKTTIHKILCGFYENYTGSVTVLGKELSEWNLEELRKNIASVNQEIYLFSNTILENIRYGNQEATDEQVVLAAKQAYAHDFVMEFEKGYETQIGERGTRLSGGQRQRIAIARAILKNAPVVLLDEPTSALDTKSEYFVQLALEKLEQGRTVLIIAHRLSTIENSDKIIVIDNGVVCEQGNHKSLLKSGEKYSDLYKRQVFEKESIRK